MQHTVKEEIDPVSESSESLVGLSDEALLSAWMDGVECGDYGNSRNDGVQNRQVWEIYHLVGDTLRNPDLAIKTSGAFRARLTRALDAELSIVAAPKRRASSLRLGISGLAAVAALAAVVWAAQPYLNDGGSSGTRVAEANYASAGNTSAVDDAALGDYLEAHRQMAGPSAVRQVSFANGLEH
jgi:sigma-E factor negative regulatory protein RseA